MVKFLKINIINIIFLCTKSLSFETYQLPLSKWLQKSFPKLNSPNFIIANTQLNIVLHESNSNILLRCGTFSDLIFACAMKYKFGRKLQILSLSSIKKFPNNINKKLIIDSFLMKFGIILPKFTDITLYSDGELISLYDMCNIFRNSFSILSKSFFDESCFKFKSKTNGNGNAFKFINKNGCEFICILFGAQTEENIEQDMRVLCQWLDIFLIKKLKNSYKLFTKIPVFYGTKNYLPVVLNNSENMLCVSNHKDQIARTIRYKMRVTAPIKPLDQIGWIFYKTSIFDNPIKKNIFANTKIDSSSAIKSILDSISFIIYNRPYRLISIK